MKIFANLALALGFLSSITAAQMTPRPASPPRTTGTIASFEGRSLKVQTNGGEVQVLLAPNARIVERRPGSLSDVRANQFIGVTAVESKGGKLRAMEIHVIPEELRGLGEGHYPMDQAKTTMTNGNLNTMTNGNLSTMTNGNLARTGSGAAGSTLSVTYKGGQSEIDVRPGVPVTVMAISESSVLRQGRKLTIFGSKDGNGVVNADILIVDSTGSQ